MAKLILGLVFIGVLAGCGQQYVVVQDSDGRKHCVESSNPNKYVDDSKCGI